MNQELYSIADTAERWSVSPDTVRRLIQESELRSVCIGSRRMIPRAEVERAELMGVGMRKKSGPKPKLKSQVTA
jgi:excisionase family DNA binding protein